MQAFTPSPDKAIAAANAAGKQPDTRVPRSFRPTQATRSCAAPAAGPILWRARPWSPLSAPRSPTASPPLRRTAQTSPLRSHNHSRHRPEPADSGGTHSGCPEVCKGGSLITTGEHGADRSIGMKRAEQPNPQNAPWKSTMLDRSSSGDHSCPALYRPVSRPFPSWGTQSAP